MSPSRHTRCFRNNLPVLLKSISSPLQAVWARCLLHGASGFFPFTIFFIFVRFIHLQLHDELMTSSVWEPAQEGQIHNQCKLHRSSFLRVPERSWRTLSPLFHFGFIRFSECSCRGIQGRVFTSAEEEGKIPMWSIKLENIRNVWKKSVRVVRLR